MTKPDNLTDEQLMTSLKLGDESAFNELYKRYSQRILYFMFKMLNQDEQKAQDFTQDVFIKVIESASKFDASKSFKTWIFAIAANHGKNYYRSKESLSVGFEPNDSDHNGVIYLNNLHDKSLFMQEFNKELETLKSPYKETFVLRYSEHLKIAEIAEIMSCPVGTIKSRLNYSVNFLAKKLAPYRSIINHKDNI